MDKILEFLTGLAANNNREWFNDNKSRYDESRKKILFLTEVIINEVRKFDHEIPAITPNDCVFRIFRDVRFSNDKRPYKTNFGAFIARGGRKSTGAGYYFHIDPEESFAGGGVYMPAPGTLKLIRESIAENGGEFLEIINNEGFKKLYPSMWDDKLKTVPKGFPKDHEYVDLLKYKSFAFTSKIEKSDLLADNYIEKIVNSFRLLYPANRFLNKALQNNN